MADLQRLTDLNAANNPTDKKLFRLGDLDSMQREKLDASGFDANGFVDVGDAQRKLWKERGKIGYMEAAQRVDKTEMIPFNPEGAIKSVRLLNAVNRIKDDQNGKPIYAEKPGQRSIDLIRINNFLLKTEEERVRGFTIMGKVTSGVAALPGFMVEFIASGGLIAVGKKAITKGAVKVVEQASKSVAKKVLTTTTGLAVNATLRTALQPHRVTGGFADRQISSQLELTDAGLKIAETSAEKPHISFMKSVGDVMIENFSELTGPFLSKGVSTIAKKVIPVKLSDAIAKLYRKLHPNDSIEKIATAAGYNGFLEELGEERVGALLRAVTGVEDFGAGKDANVFDRIVASIPSGEEMLVESLILAVPGATKVGVQQTISIIERRKQEDGTTIEPESKGEVLSEEQIDEILAVEEGPVREGEEAVKPVELKETAPTTEELALLKFSEKAFPELNQQLQEAIEKRDAREIRKKQEAILKQTADSINDILAEQKTDAEKVASLNTLLETNFTDIKEAQAAIKEFRVARASIRKEIKKTTPKIVQTRKLEETILKDRIRTLRTGFKVGKRITTKETQEVQSEAIKLINQSDLEAVDKAKFLKFIKNLTPDNFAKQSQVLEERISNLEERANKRALINNFKKLTKPSEVRNLRPEFRGPIQSIIDLVTAVKPGQKRLNRLKSLAEFLEREPDNEVPQSAINELRILDQKPLADLTLEELENVVTSVATFVKLNALKNKIIVNNKLRDFKEIEDNATDNILKNFSELEDSIDGIDTFQQSAESGLYATVKSFLFGADSLNTEYKAEELDNEDKGVIWQILYKDMADGSERVLEVQHEAEDFFEGKIGDINIDRWSKAFVTLKKKDLKSRKRIEKKVDIVEVKLEDGRTVTMTRGEKISLFLHGLNAKNRKHLLVGGFNFTTSTQAKPIVMTEADLANLSDSMSRNELKVAEAMSEYLNTIQKDNINEVSVDLLGREIATEQNYWMIRTNLLDVQRSDKELVKKRSFSKKTLEGLGIFKERQNAANSIILEDAFTAIMKNIYQTSAYVGLAKPLRSAKAFLASNKIQRAMIEVNRRSYLRSLQRYVEQIEGESIRLDNFEVLTQELINKLDSGILGLNPWVMLKQPISYMVASTEMDAGLLVKAFRPVVSKAEVEEMKKHSTWLRDRLDGNVSREMGEVSRVGRVMKFFTKKEVISQRVMEGIKRFDRIAVASIWRAAKLEVKQKFPNLSPNSNAFFEKVDARSWEVIRRTQPTFNIVDRSSIGASRNLALRLGTKYSSQRNKNWIVTRRAITRYNRSHKTPKDKAKLATAFTVLAILSPLMLMGVDELRDILYGRERKTSFFKRMTLDWFKLEFGNIYFLGTFVNSLTSKIERGTYAGFDINNPVTSTFNDLATILAEGVRAVEQAATGERYRSGRKRGEKKWKESVKRFATRAMDVGGRVKGINISTVRKFIQGAFVKTKDLIFPNSK